LEVALAADVPDEIKELTFPVSLYDDQNKRVWGTTGKITFAKDKPSTAAIKLEKIEKPENTYRVEVTFDRRDLDLITSETIYFGDPKRAVQAYGSRREGEFPDERLFLVLKLNAVEGRNVEAVGLTVTLRDSDQNIVLDKLHKVPVSRDGTQFELDITPEKESVGPYTLEYGIEDDALGLYFDASETVALANALVPVSSVEIDDASWFGSGSGPGKSGQYYYSSHLTDQRPDQYPTIVYDEEAKHSGTRSLRIDYTQGRQGYVYGRLTMPGLPTRARIWVKGNNTSDTLMVHWSDNIDLFRQAWYRSANFSGSTVCTLNFEGWRSFRVPVLGDGLQVKRNLAGSSPDIDAPVSLLAFNIQPGRPPKDAKRGEGRSIWIDDIYAETQAHAKEQASIELRADTPDHLLHKGARVYASVGNGSSAHVKKGKLRLRALNSSGEPLMELNETVEIPPGAFVVREFALAGAHAKSPLGPIDVDVSFMAPAVAGLRKTQRIAFKSAQSFGLFWDFEKDTQYNGLWEGKGGSCAPGGAEGSAKALRLAVEPIGPPSDPRRQNQLRAPNSVLLHPAMPGMVDRIQVMIKGSGKPVVVRPALLDNGLTGVWMRDYNIIWLPPVKVDWQGWRKVELIAPAVPANYAAESRYFLREPCYPLNLFFKAELVEDQPTEVHFDNIRVKTHLPPEEELSAHVDYPNDSRIHKPGAPLELVLKNFSAGNKSLAVSFRLDSFQQRTEAEQTMDVAVPAGRKIIRKLVASLKPGIYTLTVRLDDKTLKEKNKEAEDRVITEIIHVLDATHYFGPKPLEFLGETFARPKPELRKTVDMTVEKVYLDWDNMEAMPGFFHYQWFYKAVEAVSAGGAYEVMPIVGFSADWAGPHAQERIARGTYSRFMGNYLQVPVRLTDWSAYVRECAREFNGKFRQWVFWENPDIDGPQGISPNRYAQMLKIFHKWIALYDPKARVVAGGFNFDRALGYLEAIENLGELQFDQIDIQMSLGELSPERADVEGFLDELNQVLGELQTRPAVQLTETDWPIGEYVTPAQHAAYHARTLLILNSRGVRPHRFTLVNGGRELKGYGLFYSTTYGNSLGVQHFKPFFVPKPAYFAFMHIKKFLEDWKFRKSVLIPDANLQANRAFIYRNAAGRLTAVVWRAAGDPRTYKTPASWREAKARDAFGFDLSIEGGLSLAALPKFIELPQPYTIEQLAYDLRMLSPVDGTDVVLLDLYVGEPDSCKRASYSATGQTETKAVRGKLAGGRKLAETFVFGLQTEQFEFQMAKPGNVLMGRRWEFAGEGRKLTVQLNDAPAQPWDLTMEQGNYSGVRESTFVLRGCVAGTNVLKIGYEKPGNCSGYRLEQLESDHVDLTRWGVLNAMQTKGELQKYESARGTPLTIVKTQYANGLGTHAVSLIEYPLDGQFSSFEVTAGVDAVTDGRGSVTFEIYVDGKEEAKTGQMNGFSQPETLKVEGLENARRMHLIVKDGGDKNQDDLADWVDGKLFLK
ncbi:MAG: NPCBM/NEW2 domain-containing protein, partial [Planctomycetes bacterium]|nr:NPCBM/NEW2 domain-containing protein [Planctomycetota bacterium]